MGQEHSIPPHERRKTFDELSDWSIKLSKLDAESQTNLAGTMVMSKKGNGPKVHLPDAKGEALKSLNGQGRVQLYAVELDKEVFIMIYNI